MTQHVPGLFLVVVPRLWLLLYRSHWLLLYPSHWLPLWLSHWLLPFAPLLAPVRQKRTVLLICVHVHVFIGFLESHGLFRSFQSLLVYIYFPAYFTCSSVGIPISCFMCRMRDGRSWRADPCRLSCIISRACACFCSPWR